MTEVAYSFLSWYRLSHPQTRNRKVSTCFIWTKVFNGLLRSLLLRCRLVLSFSFQSICSKGADLFHSRYIHSL
ncbi:hypothetical protein L2E82_20911 [Cichorium intybus]|uniref:Uncharacterized protein n=1 Tax=Cichorium intybus TaxID=13427 RepID=A0ACB9DUN2_CICIN|nr:hypothetical protein L2E82_20911 [Cichorium intybus]